MLHAESDATPRTDTDFRRIIHVIDLLGSIFAIFFFINILRVLPLLRDLYYQGKKPLACDVCITFWVVLALALVGAYLWAPLRFLWDLLAAAAVMGGVLALLRYFPQTPQRPPTLTREG